ncbi:integral membrane protein [Colletotrichum chrysophilum]|uniref:Integral membrane protein n=1 Tax=Colletotrichum chrysophilum TaxID=1836956 RepID=A0AAD9AK11_9PEZI|nr:integral membrane protein [Colletotrichum chrysophilum]
MDDVTYSSENSVASILIVPHAVFSVIATLLVGLRIYSARVVTKSPWTFDEHIAIAALIANHIMLISEGIAVNYGLGTEMTQILTEFPGGVSAFLKCILSIEIAYGIACPLSKLAVLTMFYRIFSASKILRYCVWAIAFGLIGWGIAVVGVSIFSCTPIARFWDQTIPGTCIDSSKFYIGITVPNIIFDILTVAVPIHEVWRLQMGREKKLAITGVFLLGGSVVLASIARLVLFIIYRPGEGATGNNISQTVIIPHAASAIETCLAIIGACLPPCAPLFRRFLGGVVSVMSSGDRYNSRPSGAAKSGNSKNFNTLVTIGKISNRGVGHRKGSNDDDLDGSFERLGDGNSLQGSTDELYVNNESSGSRRDLGAEDGIHVKREVHVERSGKVASQDVREWVTGDIPLERITDREKTSGVTGLTR